MAVDTPHIEVKVNTSFYSYGQMRSLQLWLEVNGISMPIWVYPQMPDQILGHMHKNEAITSSKSKKLKVLL